MTSNIGPMAGSGILETFYAFTKTMTIVTAVACFLSTKIWALESSPEGS
jgi:hypothetical protein